MKLPIALSRSWPARILWGLVAAVALFAVGMATARLVLFSYERLAVLAVSCLVSALVSRYHPDVPFTRFKFSMKDVLALWGVLWIGMSGGLLLAAVSATRSAMAFRGRRDESFYRAAVDVVAVYAGSTVFYLSLGYMPYTQGTMVAGDLGFSVSVVTAASLMAATQYLIGCFLRYLFDRFEGAVRINSLIVEHFAFPIVGYFTSLLFAFLTYFTFLRFGTEFGIVLVPIAILGDLAFRVHTARLGQQTRQISEASRIHLATVEALATAIDARDQVGIGHVRRTQIYAIGTGELLGLSEAEISALRTGALLHDIGKLAVPDHILNKPGQLTSSEFEKTKIHASVGGSILERIGFNYPVVPTVKYHHECWDGSGYPEGLKGGNIPLTARILSVADAYDTLRGARPYRPPVNREEACNLLMSGAGVQFDPKIVSIFLKNLWRFDLEIEANGLEYTEQTDEFQHVSDAELASEKRYVEQIKRANKEVFTLYEVARDFSSSANLHETLERFTGRIATFVPFDTCSVFLFEEGGETVIPAHSAGHVSSSFKGRKIRIGEGPTGEVLETRKPVRNANPLRDFSASQHEGVSDYVIMMSLPLIADDKLVGAVSLYSRDQYLRYEREHLRLLETISKMAAEAILKSQQHLITETHALTDPMTGLPNARSLRMHFDKEVSRAQRNDSDFQLLMLDLDGFKAVNDNFGHKVGDRMLKEVGKVILAQLRDYDFLSRYAGDEFVALIGDTQARDVAELCERIERAVGEFTIPVSTDKEAHVGVSVGAASYPENGSSFDELVVEADKAMYARKVARKAECAAEASALAAPEVKLEEVSQFVGPLRVEKIQESELSPDSYVVQLDETHIVSAAVN